MKPSNPSCNLSIEGKVIRMEKTIDQLVYEYWHSTMTWPEFVGRIKHLYAKNN